MNNNFLGVRRLYKTHMDGLKQFNSKSVTYTYIGYTEHNSRGQPIVCHLQFLSHQLTQSQPGLCPHITTGIPRFSVLLTALTYQISLNNVHGNYLILKSKFA